jgi:DeoR family fructose operon transcriptional repressor
VNKSRNIWQFIKLLVRLTYGNLLDTSEATVRRDLEWLEQKGILERTHGGAVLSQRMLFEQEYQQRAQHLPDEKKRIGELAASLIEDGDIVFINSGTTATQVIRHIRRDLRITVFTQTTSAPSQILLTLAFIII